MATSGVASARVALCGIILSECISYLIPASIGYVKLDKVDFDEEIIIYHGGTSEIRRINVDYYTRIISK